MTGKKIISDIVLPKREKLASEMFKEPIQKFKPPQKKSNKKAWIIFTVFIFAVFAVWALGLITSRIKVTISPKIISQNIEKKLVLSKTADLEGAIAFSTVSFPYSQGGQFKATDQKSKEVKAKGTVVIFNKSKDSQVLIASTRLATSDGKIYRIPRTIVIAAAKTSGTALTPGSKEVEIEADKPGESYNIDLSDFTLPGLQGSPKFQLVFGRSKTEMKGGSSGEYTVVGKSDSDAAIANLVAKARKSAADIILSKIPAEELLLTPSVEYVILKESIEPATGEITSNFEAKIEGEIRGSIINKRALESALEDEEISSKIFGKNITGKVRIKNLDKLSLLLSGYKFDTDFFTLDIKGRAEIQPILGEADLEMLKNVLVEEKISSATALLERFPEIYRAEFRLKPFWIGFFNKNPVRDSSHIDIILESS